MDLLLQVPEKELEEFSEPPVDHTDQDKPDRSNTGGTHSSNISHHLQTQTSTASKASKVLTASLHSNQKCRYRQPATQLAPSNWQLAMRPAMQPVALYTFTYRKEQCNQSHAHIPPLLTLQVEPNLKMISRTLSPEALRYLHLGIHIGKSHPHL